VERHLRHAMGQGVRRIFIRRFSEKGKRQTAQRERGSNRMFHYVHPN
jgi:hypothetical protein